MHVHALFSISLSCSLLFWLLINTDDPHLKCHLMSQVILHICPHHHVVVLILRCRRSCHNANEKFAQWWTMPRTSGLVLLYDVSSNESYLSLLYCRVVSVGCMHPPHAQSPIPTSSDFSKSFSNMFPVWVIFEFFNSSSICFFAIRLHLFNSGVWNAWDSKINTMVTSFSRSSDFLESVISTSFWACCEFGTGVTRGNQGDWYTLQ